MAPVLGCSQQVVVELVGRDGSVNNQQIESALDSAIAKSTSVSTRQGRFDADKEIVVKTRDSIILEEDVDAITRTVSNEIISQNLGFEISEWRIEAV